MQLQVQPTGQLSAAYVAHLLNRDDRQAHCSTPANTIAASMEAQCVQVHPLHVDAIT